MTYNVFGGTLTLTQSINHAYFCMKFYATVKQQNIRFTTKFC